MVSLELGMIVYHQQKAFRNVMVWATVTATTVINCYERVGKITEFDHKYGKLFWEAGRTFPPNFLGSTPQTNRRKRFGDILGHCNRQLMSN